MSIGASIRRMFGPYERRVSEAYRSIYLNIDEFVEQVRQWSPYPRRILEVGCGEGAITERLHSAFPNTHITAIDATSRIGRLYQGPQAGVCFTQCEIQEIGASKAGAFDLVVLCDVLHHVPLGSRQGLLDAIRVMLAPHGMFIFKDWQRSNTPVHWLCYASDRWLTGDRITYMTRDEMRQHLALTFGANALVGEMRVGPRWNNLSMLVRP
jgi:2-polyprenyl-6-hydroxyphenyl methylase/3-demethylubiquinone-9 3-methyltransferase